MQRLIFIDVTKGFAILGVILVHALTAGIWYSPGNALNVLPTWMLAVLAPLVILATWAGFFELMSGLSNMYNMYNRIVVKQQGFKKAAQGPLVNSTGLLVMHFLFVIFFSHRRNAPYPDVYTGEINTMISGSFELGKFHVTDFQFFFFADVLGSIALAGYLSIFLIWVVHKFIGLENVNKARKVLLVMAVVFFVISYPIWDWGYPHVVSFLQNGSPGALILALPLSMLTGAFQPFFPIAGFGILGVILGYLLAVGYHRQEDPEFYSDQEIPTVKQFMKRLAPVSLSLFVIFLLHYLFILKRPALGILVYFRLPPIMLTLNIALMLWGLMFAIKLFEDPDLETRRRRASKTIMIRRFGMVSLSVYVFESVIDGIFSLVYHTIFNDPSTPNIDESFTLPIPIIMYLIILFTLWFVAIKYWEEVSFAYGIEYWIIRIGSRFRSTKSHKLDLTNVLHYPLGRSEPVPASD